MGGRGSLSASSGSSFDVSTSNVKEICDRIQNVYGIKVESSVRELDVSSVRSLYTGIEGVYEEFGVLPHVRSVSAEKLPSMTAGQATSRMIESQIVVDISISNRPDHYGDLHMDGIKGTVAHELGHALVSHIINNEFDFGFEKIHAHNTDTIPKQIVQEAAKRAKTKEYGKGKSISSLRSSISAYAGWYNGAKGSSEALAEAVDDFVVNGRNAKPFSLEIIGVLKERLG